jgi:hypothetical protein
MLIQPTMMALAAGFRHDLSTELPSLFGALLRIASPSADLVEQTKLHFMVWRWFAETRTRRIAGAVFRSRPES